MRKIQLIAPFILLCLMTSSAALANLCEEKHITNRHHTEADEISSMAFRVVDIKEIQPYKR